MIHGPCNTLNPNSSCMIDGKCSKRYPRALIFNTVTGNDGYLLYGRLAEDDGKLATMQTWNGDIEVAVVHLAAHLENGQCVYFTAANMQQIAPNPPAFFTLRQTDAFAKTLLFSEVPTYFT
ncbi:unnamed protein product [Onchocerca ochengi]|uniref:DOMON domain-containing protein n=1 Tax=Onchocerca ochengi TaxID=42157 RepID=A0A182EKU9_ONCOC|nr:unnamed protein product [Onchocerca ochengi]